MKFFSNFDTNIKTTTVEAAVQQYGEENVLCISKSGLYLLTKVIFPLFRFFVLDVVLIMFFYYAFDYSYLFIIVVIVLLISIPFVFYVLGKYIDYKMDFVIATPDSLIEYNQSGVFSKKVVTINEKSIKTITVERRGILYSIFNNGDLIFLSEGDETRGDITLHYVFHAEQRRNEAAKIMNKN